MASKLVRFDWAIKKLLRHNRNADRANFTILEGFLTELLKFEVTIESILEGESNKKEADDKYNRVDVLVSSSEGELMLVEVQNESQVDRPAIRYFQRKEKLKEETLSQEELIAYERFQENRRIERSEIETALKEGEEKGIEKGIEKVALNAIQKGKSDELITELTGLIQERIRTLRNKNLP